MASFSNVGMGRTVAPGLELGFYDRLAERFAEIPVPPDALLLVATLIVPLALAGIASSRMRHRRRLADEGLRRRAEDATGDLASLRLARMAHVRDVPRLD